MPGDGAIPGSPKAKNVVGGNVRNVCSGYRPASSTAAKLRAGAPPERRADEAPTPFFDLLTTMIQAHAAESGRAPQHAGATDRVDALLADRVDEKNSPRTEISAAPPVSHHRRRAQQLNVCVVGLMVAIGNVIYVSEAGNKVSEVGKEQPPVIVADEALQARSVVIGNATASDKPMERPLQTEEPGGSRTIGVEEARLDEGEIGTKSTPNAQSNEPAVATPAVGQPVEKPASDTEDRADVAAGGRVPSEVVSIDPIAPAANASAEEPPRQDASSSPDPMPGEAVRTDPIAPAANAPSAEPSRRVASSPPPVARETRPAIDRANHPVATQVTRVISGVSMRAGPSNGQPVLATIPRGSSIEVIKCRDWCEVIFAGRRGWVYKSFIRAPLADVARSPERTKPSPRKAGSSSGVLRGTRTSASDPHRPKPVAVRMSAGQSTQDARSGSQSSSGNIFWDTVGYLWKQILPTGPRPNSD
jgi:uncharacterized protein YraI